VTLTLLTYLFTYLLDNAGEAVYTGLTLDMGRQLLYFTDEAQGHVTELRLNYNNRSVDDVTTDKSRIVDSTAGSRPRSIAVDTVNR